MLAPAGQLGQVQSLSRSAEPQPPGEGRRLAVDQGNAGSGVGCKIPFSPLYLDPI